MYRFASGAPPGHYKSLPVSLYNTEQHRFLQTPEGWHSFYVLNEAKKSIVASSHFHVEDGVAYSPYRAPFGGIELQSRISKKVLTDFIEYFEACLRKVGVHKIVIKHRSRFRDESNPIEQSLFSLGFQLEKSEMSSMIPVMENFAAGLHYSERKRLNKSIRSKFSVQQLPITELKSVYHFIRKCRAQKKYDVSMSWPEMEKLSKQFGDAVIPFAVKDEDEIIAAAICIRVNKEMLYDFYHDHSSKYDQHSPIVLLMSEIHKYCHDHKIKWIDLGTSMLGDQINTGLHRFKLRLGAMPAVKNSFIKILG